MRNGVVSELGWPIQDMLDFPFLFTLREMWLLWFGHPYIPVRLTWQEKQLIHEHCLAIIVALRAGNSVPAAIVWEHTPILEAFLDRLEYIDKTRVKLR